MRIVVIIGAILLLYGAFSTIFHDTALVGKFGSVFGDANLYLFGFVGYIILFLLMYPMYQVYQNRYLVKRIDFIIGWFVLFFAIILLGGMLFDMPNSGKVGSILVGVLLPYIGLAGVWMFWLMLTVLGAVFVVDDNFSWRDFADSIKNKFDSDESSIFSSMDFGNLSLQPIIDWMVKLFNNPFGQTEEKDNKTINKQKNIERNSVDDFDTPSYIKRGIKYSLDEESKQYESQNILSQSIEATKAVEQTFIKDVKVEDNINISSLHRKIAPKASSGVEIIEELEENAKILSHIDKGVVAAPKNFRLPKLEFLTKAPKSTKKINEDEIDRKIKDLLDKLKKFNIEGDVVRTYSGPLVTTFEFKPAPHVKISKILGLQDDLAMALSAETIRIQAPIPGRDVVGIEIPNETIETIYLRDILESKLFRESQSPLTVALGMDIVGKPFITDIKKLPHLLIAGTTGSGKSVGINAMILSLLYRNDPDQLKLMMIDPKMLEFSIYNDIPHLITPVITSPKKAIAALANMVREMERRYVLMAENRTKNIENYNEKVTKNRTADALPYIVIVIDELADLMMNGGKEVEYSIARLAQMARASGIHLIVATQRPSVDVVTGLIKANLPSRLSYRVGQRIDSKVILDAMGAESLLGRGDALFTPPGSTGLVRLHAPWNSEEEIEKIVEFLKAQRLPDYDESYLVADNNSAKGANGDMVGELDPLYEQAKDVIMTDGKTSISYLQRKLQIGYNRSANIIEQLEAKGVLSSPNNKGNREIL